MATTAEQSYVEALQSLYKENQVAHLMLDVFAGYQRNRTVTKVDNLLWKLRSLDSNADVSRAGIVSVFRELEKMSYGRFIAGRWSHPSRFQWTANLIGVGQAASGENTAVAHLPENNVDIETEIEGEEEPDFISHSFQLRPDLPIALELPADLTGVEADRLAKFISSLPFGD